MDSTGGLWGSDSLGQVDPVAVLRRVLAAEPGPRVQSVLCVVGEVVDGLGGEARELYARAWRRQAQWCVAQAEPSEGAVTLHSP